MSKKLFVGSIPFRANEDDLKQLFSEFGEVVSVNIVRHLDSGRSKGFAFVEMDSENNANNAIQALNDSEFGGRAIKVSVARSRESRENSSNF